MIITNKKEVDVLVIGGGTAGTFAAISASRTGAKTLLVEKTGKLGGTMTSAGVNFPGLFHAWGKQIIAGPCWESIERALKTDHREMPEIVYKPEHHWQLQISVNMFTFAAVLDQMCEETNVEVLFHTMFAYGSENSEGITAVLTSKEGLKAVKAKCVVDATGDADVAGIMGYIRLKSETLQPGTLINNLGGYNADEIDKKVFDSYLQKAFQHGIIEKKDTQGADLYTMLKQYRISMHIDNIDASTSEGKSEAERKARKALLNIVQFLKTIPKLENLHVQYFAEECGIRETYRIDGEAYITADKYLNGYHYDDAICYAFYPIDLHIPEGIKQIFLNDGIIPVIPYGALIPKSSKRLIAAGRCISGDTDANSAYRVQAPCMATGQVAGVAAAISALNNIDVKEIPLETLREKLKKTGAIVP